MEINEEKLLALIGETSDLPEAMEKIEEEYRNVWACAGHIFDAIDNLCRININHEYDQMIDDLYKIGKRLNNKAVEFEQALGIRVGD